MTTPMSCDCFNRRAFARNCGKLSDARALPALLAARNGPWPAGLGPNTESVQSLEALVYICGPQKLAALDVGLRHEQI